MRRLLTPGWLACHAAMVALVAGMLWLAGWQLSRATGGNALSWGYAFQWPVFAGFVVVVWAREIRRTLRRGSDLAGRAAADEPAVAVGQPAVGQPVVATGRPVITRRRAPVPDEADDSELAAYNRYLAWLSANPGAKPGDYPG